MGRPVLALAVAAALLASLVSCRGTATSEAAPAKKPNIIFVLTDDLASNLVDYMPRVKEMQRQGMTFSNYFVTDSLCCPSRSTIFTGKFPHNTGVFTNEGPDGGYQTFKSRGNDRATFATALQKSGYRTAMMAKYLNGYQPTDPVPPGWDEWAVAGNGYPEYNYTLNENGKQVRYGNEPKDYLTDVLAEKGTDFVSRAAKAQKPFMMEISTFAPHGPYTPAPRHTKMFPGLRAPRGPAFNEPDLSDKPSWLRDHPRLRPAQIRKIDTAYRKRARSVQAVDEMLGRLQSTLKATGTDRDTYLVFTSDNGFHMGEHRLAQGKQTAFDTDIKVPLVITGPGVQAGSTNNALTQNTDLCPTFEQLGGAPVPNSVDGQSLVPALRGAATPKRDAVLIEHHGPNNNPADPDRQNRTSGNPPTYKAIRTTTELYVEYADGQREYYNLRTDPAERTNTAGNLPPQRLKQLRDTLYKLGLS